jgi:hypothetical protein
VQYHRFKQIALQKASDILAFLKTYTPYIEERVMNAFARQVLMLCVLAVLAPAGMAETVKVPVGQQGADLKSVVIPKRGILKSAVVAQFGEPLSKSTPVGDPPITYWNYENYTVYFEYDRVLDTVLNYTGQGGTGK